MEKTGILFLLLWISALQAEPTHNTTEVEPFFILANGTSLKKISLDGSSSTVLKQDLTHASALDFDYQQQMIYWIEVTEQSPPYGSMISRMHINGSDVQVLHNMSTITPWGLAVDWVGGNIYWCDLVHRTIGVSKLNGSYPTVLVNTDLEHPFSMTVDVRNGYLYWSDLSENNPHIGRMGMDGTNRRVIVKDKISKPYGLMLDYINDHIYWSNGEKYIEFANLDGTNRHTVVSQNKIWTITLFEDHIYWTSMKTSSIYRANKTQGTNEISLISNLMNPIDFHIYHPYRQPEVSGHPCQTNNGGCSNLCLLSPGGGYKCA